MNGMYHFLHGDFDVVEMRTTNVPGPGRDEAASAFDSSAKRLRHPNPDRIVTMRRQIRKSLRSPEVVPERAPRSALGDALLTSAFDDRRRSCLRNGVVRRCVTVFDPLGDVADHVVNTERVRLER